MEIWSIASCKVYTLPLKNVSYSNNSAEQHCIRHIFERLIDTIELHSYAKLENERGENELIIRIIHCVAHYSLPVVG